MSAYINLKQGHLPVACVQHSWLNFRQKTPTLNNINNIRDNEFFSTTHLHQVLHVDIQSDSCMVLNIKFHSCKPQKFPAFIHLVLYPSSLTVLYLFWGYGNSLTYLSSFLLLTQALHFLLYATGGVYSHYCKGGMELKGQISCSNSNSSCGLGRLQKFKWGHSRSGHTKHVEGKYWQFTTWHFYDPLECEAKEDAITFFCYDRTRWNHISSLKMP